MKFYEYWVHRILVIDYLVPLFEKEGLGEILLKKSPSIPLNPPQSPFSKGGGKRLLSESVLLMFLWPKKAFNVTVFT